MDDFKALGASMRRMQNKYFSSKSKDERQRYLIAAKEAERKFDNALHADGYHTVSKEDREEQQKLFG